MRTRPPALVRAAAAAAALLALASLGPQARGGALGDIDFRIPRGAHEGVPRGIADVCLSWRVDRFLSFEVLFPRSAAYLTADPSNQLDWNKLLGITTPWIHRNSIRLGWRWLPAEGKMELGFYGYARGRRIEQALAKVDLDTWVPVTLRLHNGGLSAEAAGARYEHHEHLGLAAILPALTVILETAYFGGDETAPHDIDVFVRNIASR